jgi:hypothetical protein
MVRNKVYIPTNLMIFKLLILSMIIPFTNHYRFAWRPTNKVFPYEEVPPPSLIDNGDNDGLILSDVINRKKQITISQDCITAWIGDGKCNVDNNKEVCRYDRGDCCAKTCMRECLEILEDGSKNFETFNITRKIDRPCPFECGVLNYDCIEPHAGCYTCNLNNAIC